jgi:hypothetical protein
MNFVHSEVTVASSQAIVVELDRAANVNVMDNANFQRYRQGRSHQYYGGYVTQTPYAIRPPHAGRWHVAVDLGGYAGRVRVAVRAQ